MANACMLLRASPFSSWSQSSEQPISFSFAPFHAPLLPRSSFVGAALHQASLYGRPSSSSTSPSSLPLGIQCNSQRRPQYIPNRIDDPQYVRIFDTTLRDGEQSPGATLTSKEKLDIARQLAKLGVDIIEAGFPIASPDDLEAVKLIAEEVGNDVNEDGYVPVICGLARCNKADIDAAWEGVKHALRPRIHTFIATSEIHMQYKLRKSPDEVVKIARDMVAYARSLGCEDVEFSPEDAGRSDPEFLYRILEEVIKAGATTLNIPDTVGYTLPEEFGQLIAKIKANTKGAENVIISTHCQNDLGLSTANTLAGAANGARQLEVTINGIGERAGNASLEEGCTDIDAGKDKLISPTFEVELLQNWCSDTLFPALISFPAILSFSGSAHAEVLNQQINQIYGDLGDGLEIGAQVLYLAALLGLVGVASYFVVRQVLIRRDLESAARDLQDRVRTGEAIPVEYFELGAVMLRKKFYPLASKYLEQAIAKWDGDPQDLAQVHNALGFSYVNDNLVDRGIAEYMKAVKLQPGYVVAWNNLGSAYEKKKNLRKALDAYEEALRFDPNNDVAKEYRDALKKRVERLEGIPVKNE